MLYKVLADVIVVMHFGWILFLLTGFILIPAGFWWRRFFDLWLFRTIHLGGIIYASLLTIMGKFCPLTVWEYNLRQKYDPDLVYPGSFIISHIEKLVYPDVNPLIVQIPTVFIAVFTILVFIVRPPGITRKI